MYYLDNSILMSDYLRTHIIDYKNRVEFEQTQSIVLTSSRVYNIIATKNISHIQNVKLNSNLLTKYRDWVYDNKNRNIILLLDSVPSGDTLEVDIYSGTNWIFHDRPTQSLSKEQFPRISVVPITSTGNRLGNDRSINATTYRFQVNTFVKKDTTLQVSIGLNQQVNLQDNDLALYINNQVYNALIGNTATLHPLFSNLEIDNRESREDFLVTDLNAYNIRLDFTILEGDTISRKLERLQN